MRLRLSKLSGEQKHIVDGAEFFVVCMDTYRLRRLIEYRGGKYGTTPLIALKRYFTVEGSMPQREVVLRRALAQQGLSPASK